MNLRIIKTMKFAVVILTHKRPYNVRTVAALKQSGYTGDIFLILDDEDPTIEQYKEIYGDNVILFKRSEAARNVEPGDNFGGLRGLIYARNSVFGIAAKLHLDHFVCLDDDYTSFNWRFDSKGNYKFGNITNLDAIFQVMAKFLDKTSCKSLAIGQGGDFIGGELGGFSKNITLKRKCMNFFLCKTDRPFKFFGRMNEDVNCYLRNGNIGELYFTLNQLSLQQLPTQTLAGGVTDLYKQLGTYVKSFYSVMYCPSMVKVAMLNTSEARVHHKINWRLAVPRILPEVVRKSSKPSGKGG